MPNTIVPNVINHSTDAGFRTWVQEIITILVTTLGLTQTNDTGQINTSTVVHPANSTSGGYIILAFNDSLQATAPIYIKLEFGTGGNSATPQMWITIGTGTNGAGTLNGVVSARSAVANGITPLASTSFITRACYSAANGVLWLTWKHGANNNANVPLGGFLIYRSNNQSTGAPTGEAVSIISNNIGPIGFTAVSPVQQTISYLTNSISCDGTYSTHCQYVGNLTNSVYNGKLSISPFQYSAPSALGGWIGYSGCAACLLINEVAVGNTLIASLLPAQANNIFMSVGLFIGSTYINNQSNTNIGAALLWV